MADFFTRIAERTLGLGPIVRADLAPLFALPAQVESGGELAQSEHAVAANHSAPAETSPRRSEHPREPSQAARLRATAEQPVATMAEAGESPRGAAEFAGEAAELFRQQSFQSIAALDFQTTGRRTIDDWEQTKSDIPEEKGLIAQREPVTVRPARNALWQTEMRALDRSASVAAPTIQVTIGRIDVRAVPAPAQRPTVAERKIASRLSLEQYLRERNEGRR